MVKTWLGGVVCTTRMGFSFCSSMGSAPLRSRCGGHSGLCLPNQDAPNFHLGLLTSFSAGIPRETRSAGFSKPATCRHFAPWVMIWISEMRFATKGFHLRGADFSHCRTTSESVQK
uniref:(northern house mosquito) hypothetical protein n=1 Tax=Culex pipiens TaxID=7175 RepID=A0A8D8FP32_CULPI